MIVISSCVLGFIGLTFWAALGRYLPGDEWLLMAAAAHRLPGWNPVAQIVSALGSINLIFPVWLAGIGLLAFGRRTTSFLTLLPLPLGYPIYLLLKTWISRPCPTEALVSRINDAPLGYFLEALLRRQVQTLPPEGLDLPAVPQPVTVQSVTRVIESGYPSGHALLGLILYGGLAWCLWKILPRGKVRWALTAILVALAISIGVVRVYMGLHYPSDVLGSWLLGIIFIAMSAQAGQWVAKRWPRIPSVIQRMDS